MRCDDVLLRLDQFRTGELEETETRILERHLDHCPPCAESYEELDELAGKARALLGECPSCCLEAVRERLFDRYDRIEVDGLALWVAFSARGLTMVALAEERSFDEFAWEHERRFDRELSSASIPGELQRQLGAALSGEEAPTGVDLSQLAEFERRVLEVLLTIPAGQVRPYSWVAREVGKPAAVRAVGNTCARNPLPIVVPCHRVVPAAGGIGAYAWGPEMKRRILLREGVDVDWLERLGKRHVRYLGTKRGGWYCFPTCPGAQKIPQEDLLYVHDDREAEAEGLVPCGWCKPLALSA